MPPPAKSWSNRFSELYEKHVKGTPKPPPIAPRTAALLSILFTLIYVDPFYLSSATRPSPQLSRDAPSSIRARVRAVIFSCIASTVLTVWVLRQSGHMLAPDILHFLGLWPISVGDTSRALLLVSILFAGPLFERGIVDGELMYWVKCEGLVETLGSWIGYRNYVMGPISEELIWRALIIPLHIMARFSGKQVIFLTPLYFGIAHLHHLYEFRLTNPRTPLSMAIARSLFQFTFTSLFGFYAAFVFVRTSNLLAVILTHSFCNWMGLPRFYGRVGVEAGEPIGPLAVGTRSEDGTSRVQARGLTWTFAYYVVLVVGAAGFYVQLFPLTESIHALPVVLEEQ